MIKDPRITQPMVRSGAYFGRRGRFELLSNWHYKKHFLGTRNYRLKAETQQIMISSRNGFHIGLKEWRSYLTKKFWRKLMI